MGTTHNLGQHFSKVFNIRFEDRDQKLQYVWQTSWGVSTRLVGSVIMAHGDDSGLKFPPRIAPLQIVIIPISLGNWKQEVLPIAQKLERDMKQLSWRAKLDAREEFTPGWKFSEYEMRGVPIRIEIGPRDIRQNQAIVVRRDTMAKEAVTLDSLQEKVAQLLSDIQDSMLENARKFLSENTHEVDNYQDFKSVLESKRGFIKAFWCGAQDCEDKIKEETMATIRVVPLEQKGKGKCVLCQADAGQKVYFARAY
jgi:prolyl-tRNA synthetase